MLKLCFKLLSVQDAPERSCESWKNYECMKENKFSFVSLRNEIFTFGSCKFGNDLGHYLTSRCVTISYGLD